MLCVAYHVCRKQSLQLCGRLRTKHHAFLVQEKVVIVTHCKLLPIVSVKIYINGNIPTSKMIKGALWSNGEELLINEWSKYECLFKRSSLNRKRHDKCAQWRRNLLWSYRQTNKDNFNRHNIDNGLHMRFEIAPNAAFDVRQNGLCK